MCGSRARHWHGERTARELKQCLHGPCAWRLQASKCPWIHDKSSGLPLLTTPTSRMPASLPSPQRWRRGCSSTCLNYVSNIQQKQKINSSNEHAGAPAGDAGMAHVSAFGLVTACLTLHETAFCLFGRLTGGSEGGLGEREVILEWKVARWWVRAVLAQLVSSRRAP